MLRWLSLSPPGPLLERLVCLFVNDLIKKCAMAQRRLPTRVPCTELAFIVERYTVTICETPVDSKACPQHPLIILSSIFQPNLTSPLFADFFFDGSRSRNFHIKIATYMDAADSLAKYVDSCEFTQESEQHDTAFRIHRLSVVEKRELCRVGLGLVAATIYPNLLKVGFDSGSNWNDSLNYRDLFQPKLLQGSYDIRSMRLRRAFRTFAEPFISEGERYGIGHLLQLHDLG